MGVFGNALSCGALILFLTACVPGAAGPGGAGGGGEADGVVGEEALGIRVSGVRCTAQGHMIDFRYRVVDPARSRPLLDRSLKPRLIDEATGVTFTVPNPPKVGPLRQTTLAPEEGRIYFILFANPGHYLKPGSRVAIALGEHRLEHLVVE